MTTHRSGVAGLPVYAASLALLAAVPAYGQSAETPAAPADAPVSRLTPIVVQSYGVTATPMRDIEPDPSDPAARAPSADVGDYLQSLPGISGGRMGGHGVDIAIHGQSQDRIAIVNDGTYAFGGCPNRMDPPTALMSLDSVDQVIVERGYQSVTHGPPAPAGTVRLERQSPSFDDPTVRGHIQAGVDSNGLSRFAAGQVSGGAAEGDISAFADVRRAKNYKDGNGHEVRSAFSSWGGGATLGWRLAPGSRVEVGMERTDNDDVLYAGAGMDAPEDSTGVFRLAVDHTVQGTGPLTGLAASAYRSEVNHRMDNYSLRTPGTMKMLTESRSVTVGGRLAAKMLLGGAEIEAGVDHRVNERTADSYMGMTAMVPKDPSTLSAYTWPDVRIADVGLFAEGTRSVGAATALTVGLRVDLVEAKAGKADAAVAGGMGLTTARQLYAATYGTSDTDAEETNVSALLRGTHDFGPLTGWVGVSRSVRTADATERGIARFSAGTNGWVGNPGLDPEVHYQADVGARAAGTTWSGSATAWVDQVDDFITRDAARGQAGVLRTDQASIFRNVDARLIGGEVSGAWQPADGWSLTASVAYTWAENTTDDRPLYQIPPLNGAVEATYALRDWTFGSRLRWAISQSRIDDSTVLGSGLDTRETPAYTVADIFTTWSGLAPLDVRIGVTNLFDEAYANHLSRSNGVDPQMVQVNEPGRSVYLQGRIRF
jgi:iron complex outermembrane receptor protein